MSDNNCSICDKSLRVPPNELVAAGKEAHTLCVLQQQAEDVFVVFGEIKKVIDDYDTKCKQSTALHQVRHDMYMERVSLIIHSIHNRTNVTEEAS